MRNHLSKTVAGCVFAIAGMAQLAQAQGQPPPLAVPHPTYVTIPMEITVNRPAAEVWKRVGKYCDITEWLQVAPCTIVSGKDGEIGAVRSGTLEILVGKSEMSYTYDQPVREGRPYNQYHGTLEARPLTKKTCNLLYTLVLDNSMLPDDAAREKDIEARRARFTQALKNMKILAEGGKLPPPPGK
jgi:Polyketide cyclase / dehydrase and lipid transport